MFTFACEKEQPQIYLTERTIGLKMTSSYKDNILRVLICDPYGEPIRAGEG